MLQAAWAAFEVRVQSEAPDLLEDLRALASLVPSLVGSGSEPTLLRQPTPAPTGPAPLAPSSPAAQARFRRGGGASGRVWHATQPATWRRQRVRAGARRQCARD